MKVADLRPEHFNPRPHTHTHTRLANKPSHIIHVPLKLLLPLHQVLGHVIPPEEVSQIPQPHNLQPLGIASLISNVKCSGGPRLFRAGPKVWSTQCGLKPLAPREKLWGMETPPCCGISAPGVVLVRLCLCRSHTSRCGPCIPVWKSFSASF